LAVFFVVLLKIYKMKEKKVINGNWVVAALLVVIGIIIYFGIQPKESETALKEEDKVVKLDSIMLFQQKVDEFMHTPENYLIDYYTYVNTKEWQKMEAISNKRFDAQQLEDTFSNTTITGLKIFETIREGKEVAIVKAVVSFKKATGDIETKELSVRLELATDYVTWIISPFTSY